MKLKLKDLCDWEEFEPPENGLRRVRCIKSKIMSPRIAAPLAEIRGWCGHELCTGKKKQELGCGPGSRLSKLLHMMGLKPGPGCNCDEHIAQMNAWGPDRCTENLETIVSWLEESAKNQGVFFWRPGARWLVRLAIAQSRRGDSILKETDFDADTPQHIVRQFRFDEQAKTSTISVGESP
jgi:hypothetical protein